MKPSTLFDVTIMDKQHYVIGYSLVRKSRCEIFNFISPTLRILRFTQGSAQWRIDGAIECFTAGDVVIFSNLNKRNIHKIQTGTISYELYDFYPAGFFNEQLWNVFYSKEHLVVSAADEAAGHIYALIDMLRAEILRPDDPYRIFSIQMHLNILTVEFQRRLSQISRCINASLLSVAGSVRYISEHLFENLRLQALADLCGYSPAYYSRIFKKYIGVSPMQYIARMRLENAVHLMNHEHMNILDAAYQSGFQTSSAFYKAFQAQYSTSPTKYLKRMLLQDQ